MQLHLVTVAFEPRIKRVQFQLVYDPDARQIAHVAYSDPRVLGRLERADRMQAKLAALTPADLDALREHVRLLGGTVLEVDTRTYTEFVAQYYYRGAPIWFEDWTPDDDTADARAMAQAATLEMRLVEVMPTPASEDGPAFVPRIAVRLLPDGRLQLAHNLEGMPIEVTIIREDVGDRPVIKEGTLEGHPAAVIELRDPMPTPTAPPSTPVPPAVPAPRPEPA